MPGGRSRQWVKVKVRRHDEWVVGGWSGGAGNREGGLGSLLVGTYDAPGGGDPPLRGPGRFGVHRAPSSPAWDVGSRPLATHDCPFDPPPEPAHRRGSHWVRPEVVVEVAYGEMDLRRPHPAPRLPG